MDPVIDPFAALVARFRPRPPKLPFISGVSGDLIKDEEATDPHYWAKHVREPVRFSAGVRQLAYAPGNLFLEVGPGRTLCTLVRQHRESSSEPRAITSLGEATDERGDVLSILGSAGRLWLAGQSINWEKLHEVKPRRVSLPTYPFERKKHWIDPAGTSALAPIIENGQGEAPTHLTSKQAVVVDLMSEQKSAVIPTPGRIGRIKADLTEIFQDLSGVDLGETDPSTSFLELGFDSLFLTQVTQSLQSKFNLKITFRQLLDQLSSLEALADLCRRQAARQCLCRRATPGCSRQDSHRAALASAHQWRGPIRSPRLRVGRLLHWLLWQRYRGPRPPPWKRLFENSSSSWPGRSISCAEPVALRLQRSWSRLCLHHRPLQSFRRLPALLRPWRRPRQACTMRLLDRHRMPSRSDLSSQFRRVPSASSPKSRYSTWKN